MTQPARSIKTELNGAVIKGVRQRGPDAVGLLIVGMARLVIGAAALAVLLGTAAVFGYDAIHDDLAGITGVSAFAVWLIASRSGTTSAGRRP